MAKIYTIERFGDPASATDITAANLQDLRNKAANEFGLDATRLIVHSGTGTVKNDDVFQAYEQRIKFFILSPNENWVPGILFYSILFYSIRLLFYSILF